MALTVPPRDPTPAPTETPTPPNVPSLVPPPAPGGPPPAARPRPSPPSGELPPVHQAIICVALPCMAVSAHHGQLTGQGLEGFYRSGRRLLSQCRLRVGGREPLPVQGRLESSERAYFLGAVRTSQDTGPDPEITVERRRHAEGTERITLRSAALRPVRLVVEVSLATDLADLAAVAAGHGGPERAAGVHGSGLRWTAPGGAGSAVTADPPPQDVLGHAGLLRWNVELMPGATYRIELTVRPEHRGRIMSRPLMRPGARLLSDARAEADDPRAEPLVRAGLGDLRALLTADERGAGGPVLAAGVPWRCTPSPAESLWAARMALPLGTGLAASTLRMLASRQLKGPGDDFGRIPGPLRDTGPVLPPSCTGTEATLGYPAVLAEARRWGLPETEVADLLPTAERCLQWLREAASEDGFVPDGGPAGYRRADTQAHAHRAALLGADLLDGCGRGGGDAWREWAAGLRARFRDRFWVDDRSGGCPAAARTGAGQPVRYLGSSAAHLLDTGLLGGGRLAQGLLDGGSADRLARLLSGPDLDSGWGLRTLGSGERGHNPFGHRSGAVRVHETAVACAGLAATGHEQAAAALLKGVLGAAEAFDYRLPEMFAGEQRRTGSLPAPHPAACRPAALSAAAGIHLVATLAGIRPDAPSATVRLHPLRSAPLGAVQLSGLRVGGEPFSVRISRLGLGMIEEAGAGLRLGG
ncbi:glycogen debranching protein [Streptomyces sp. WZ.A104]|nr:glycogen debranching protein [Streptomyces sp. WZ.A104]